MCATSSTSIDYCWDPISCGNRHGGNIDYEYELITPTEDGTEDLPANETLFTPMMFGGKAGVRVSGLSCGTIYVIHVAATNNAGSGPSRIYVYITDIGKA